MKYTIQIVLLAAVFGGAGWWLGHARSDRSRDLAIALNASVDGFEAVSMQNAISGGDIASVRKSLDIAIERALTRMVLADKAASVDQDFNRQRDRTVVAVSKYWKATPPAFPLTPPVEEYIRTVCARAGGC